VFGVIVITDQCLVWKDSLLVSSHILICFSIRIERCMHPLSNLNCSVVSCNDNILAMIKLMPLTLDKLLNEHRSFFFYHIVQLTFHSYTNHLYEGIFLATTIPFQACLFFITYIDFLYI